MKKALFLLVNNLWCPCFEIGLELMKENLEQGNQVYAITCNGELPTCHSNQQHDLEQCLRCQVRLKQGLNKLNFPSKNIIKLPKTSNTFKKMCFDFKTIEELIAVELNGINLGIPVYSTLVNVLNDYKFDLDINKNHIIKVFEMTIINLETAINIINKINPDCLYFYNGRTAESRAIIEYCEKNKIEYYTYEAGGLKERYLLNKNCLPHSLENYAIKIKELWDNNTNEDKIKNAENYYIDRRNGAAQDYISFTVNQKKNNLPENFDYSKTNIVIYNASINEYVTIPEWHNHIYKDELVGLEKIFDDFKDNMSFHFYLRNHPNLKNRDNTQTREIQRIANKDYPNVTVIAPESLIDTYALMDACDKILVFGSTMGVEATFWGKPSILAGRTSYQSLDCCYKPDTHEEVIQLLKQKNLEPKSRVEALKYANFLSNNGNKFKYYKADTIFSGEFMGQRLTGEISKKHRYLIRLDKNIKQVKNMLKFVLKGYYNYSKQL